MTWIPYMVSTVACLTILCLLVLAFWHAIGRHREREERKG